MQTPPTISGTVVALHGQPGDASDWDAVAALLPDDLAFLALDRPGYGRNPRPAGSIADNVEWLIGELDRAQLTDVTLVGHSYGGGVALAAAAAAPDRVTGLVLVASIGPGAVKWWDRVLAARLVGPAVAFGALAVLPRLSRRLRPHAAPWRSFVVEQRELVSSAESWIGQPLEITVPTLILADPEDNVVPITTSYGLRDAIAGARLDPVTGGHSLPMTNPAAVASAIREAVVRSPMT